MMKRLFWLWLAACRNDDDPCVPGGTPTLELGDGRDKYTDVEDGAEVDLVHGPQGGTHLELGVAGAHLPGRRQIGVTWADAVVTGTVDGTAVAESTLYLGFRCDRADERMESWNNILVLFFDVDPVHDVDMVVDATVMDDGDAVVSATRTFHVLDPEL